MYVLEDITFNKIGTKKFLIYEFSRRGTICTCTIYQVYTKKMHNYTGAAVTVWKSHMWFTSLSLANVVTLWELVL